MAEIITPDEIKAVGDLTSEFNKLGAVLDDIIAKGEENQTAVKQAQSIKELIKNVDKLRDEEKKLTDTNKKLKEAQDKATKSTKSQAEAMDALDDNMGGVITRAKEMGKAFLALMKNPFILAIAAIVAGLAAMAHAMKTFVTTTGEGEDALNRQKAVFNQFFNVIKKGWKDLGKSFVDALGEDGLQGLLFAVLSMFSPKLAALFAKTSMEAKKLADVIDEIETNMAINITKRAKTELEYNRLLNDAEKVRRTNFEEAIQLIEKANKKKEEQLDIDRKLAEQHAEAVLLNIGLEHSLDKATVMRMSHAERDAEFTGEEMKKIAEAYAEVIMLDAKYEQEVRRNTSKLAALYEQRRLEIVKSAQDAAAAEVTAMNNQMNAEIAAVKENLAHNFKAQRTSEDGVLAYRKKAIEKSEQEIREIRRRYADDIIRKNIETLEKVLLVEELNAEERAAVEQKLFDFKTQLYDTFYDSIVTQSELTGEDIVGMYTDLTSSLNELFASFTEARLQQIDMEQAAMEKKYEREMELAGENEETKELLEKEREKREAALEKRRIQAQRKAAIFDKAVSATQAAVQTSLAIIRMLANPGGFAGTAMSVAAGITGALQVAAILAKPIPQFAKGGTTSSPFVIAGEEGIERYKTPSGQVGYTPDKPTLMKFPIGTKIDNHEETMRDLAAGGLSSLAETKGTSDDVSYALIKKLDSVERTIKNKPSFEMNWTRRGIERAIRNGESRTYFLNEFYK